MDAIDRRILVMLQANCDVTNQEIADKVGVSASSVLRRVERLRHRKVIQGRVAVLDPKAVGVAVTAFVHVRLNSHTNTQQKQALIAFLAQQEVVTSLHSVAGDIDLMLQIKCHSLEQLSSLTDDLLGRQPTVQQYYTYISMARHKDTLALPIPGA